MELNLNSFNAKLYRWFYVKRVEQMPKSLCPYFWQLLWMYIFIVPYTIIAFPAILMKASDKKSENIFITFVIYLFLFGFICLLSVPYFFICGLDKSNKLFVEMFKGGIVFWFVGIIAIVYHGIKYMIERIKNKPKNPKPNMVTEMVKAKINKICPTLTWK